MSAGLGDCLRYERVLRGDQLKADKRITDANVRIADYFDWVRALGQRECDLIYVTQTLEVAFEYKHRKNTKTIDQSKERTLLLVGQALDRLGQSHLLEKPTIVRCYKEKR